MKKVLITGTSGFIGFHLARRMLSEGWAVVGIDCITDYYDVRMKYARKQILEKSSKFKFYKVNIVNYDKLKEIFENEKPDLIVHLAAQAGVRYSLINPWAYAESNYIGTLNIFEAARTFGIKKVLYASSSSVYGANKEMPFSEDQKVDMPMSMYAVSKRANELLAYSYHNLSGMDAIGLRFFTVYGEYGRPDLALFKFAKNIIQGKEIMLFNNGEMTRNFTYVSDILDGILGIIKKDIKGYKIYNLGGPDSTSLKKFVHLIEKNLGIKAKIKLMPIQSGDVPATIADTSKANRDFGFKPKVKIEDGVKIFIDWFLKNQDWLVGLEEEKITEFSSSVTRKLFEDTSNIAVFSLAYFPFEGGAEIALREFIKRMPFGFKIFTNKFDLTWNHEEENSGASVFRVGSGRAGNYYGRNFEKILYVFRAWRKAEKEHRKRPFDAIWGMMASYGGFAALLFKLRHPKIPFILTLQEGDSEAHILRRVGVFYPLWKMIFKKADKIQVISSYLGEFAKKHGAKSEIKIIPNGVDFEVFKKDFDAPKQLFNVKRVITTSRLVHKNGIDILIRAFAKLKELEKNSKMKYVLEIAGSGPEEGNLKQLAKDLGVADLIIFKGYMEYSKIPDFLRDAYVFVRPSRSEGLGSSFLEAMALGLPIIAPRVGGIADFLRDGENGLEMIPENENDLANKLSLILRDINLREDLSRKAFKYVWGKYDWNNLRAEMKDFISSLKQ